MLVSWKVQAFDLHAAYSRFASSLCLALVLFKIFVSLFLSNSKFQVLGFLRGPRDSRYRFEFLF